MAESVQNKPGAAQPCDWCRELQVEVDRLRAQLRATEAALGLRDRLLGLWGQTRRDHDQWLLEQLDRAVSLGDDRESDTE